MVQPWAQKRSASPESTPVTLAYTFQAKAIQTGDLFLAMEYIEGRSLAEFRRASNDIRRDFMDVAEEVRIDTATASPGEPPKDEARGAAQPDAAGAAPDGGTAGAQRDD